MERRHPDVWDGFVDAWAAVHLAVLIPPNTREDLWRRFCRDVPVEERGARMRARLAECEASAWKLWKAYEFQSWCGRTLVIPSGMGFNIGFPMLFWLPVFFAWSAVLCVLGRTRRHRILRKMRAGLCPHCGYELGDTLIEKPIAVCSECGVEGPGFVPLESDFQKERGSVAQRRGGTQG